MFLLSELERIELERGFADTRIVKSSDDKHLFRQFVDLNPLLGMTGLYHFGNLAHWKNRRIFD